MPFLAQHPALLGAKFNIFRPRKAAPPKCKSPEKHPCRYWRCRIWPRYLKTGRFSISSDYFFTRNLFVGLWQLPPCPPRKRQICCSKNLIYGKLINLQVYRRPHQQRKKRPFAPLACRHRNFFRHPFASLLFAQKRKTGQPRASRPSPTPGSTFGGQVGAAPPARPEVGTIRKFEDAPPLGVVLIFSALPDFCENVFCSFFT